MPFHVAETGCCAALTRNNPYICMNYFCFFRPLLCAASTFMFVGAEVSRAEDETNAVTKTDGADAKFTSESPGSKLDSPTYLRDVLPIMMGKCARCHGDPNSVLPDWLDYRTAFNDRVEIKRRVWHSWNGSYYKQPMPAGNSAEAQSMTEDERRIIKRWVEDGAPCGVPPADATIRSKAEKIELGRRLYGMVCGVCHQPAGQGVASRFPPLARSDFFNADKHRAIKIVLNGLQGELVVNGQKFNSSMPRFPLNDQEVANILTYVFNSMGNSGKEITADEVSAARAEKAGQKIDGHTPQANIVEERNPFE